MLLYCCFRVVSVLDGFDQSCESISGKKKKAATSAHFLILCFDKVARVNTCNCYLFCIKQVCVEPSNKTQDLKIITVCQSHSTCACIKELSSCAASNKHDTTAGSLFSAHTTPALHPLINLPAKQSCHIQLSPQL